MYTFFIKQFIFAFSAENIIYLEYSYNLNAN